MNTKGKISEKVLFKGEVVVQNEIVLYKDEVNTFDHAIGTLIDVCEHSQNKPNNVLLLSIIKGNVL